MLKKTGWLSAGLTLAAFSAVASFAPVGVGSAQAAVVYCKTVGVPKGCVVRPTRWQRWSLHRSSASPVLASAPLASVFVPARR